MMKLPLFAYVTREAAQRATPSLSPLRTEHENHV